MTTSTTPNEACSSQCGRRVAPFADGLDLMQAPHPRQLIKSRVPLTREGQQLFQGVKRAPDGAALRLARSCPSAHHGHAMRRNTLRR